MSEFMSLDREGSAILAESLNHHIESLNQQITKLNNLESSDLNKSIIQFLKPQLKKLRFMQMQLTSFARSVDFEKYRKKYDKNLMPIIDYMALISSTIKDVEYFERKLREQNKRLAA